MIYVLSVQEFLKFMGDTWQHFNFLRNLFVMAAEGICPLKWTWTMYAQLDTQSGFPELTSLTEDIREFPWGHERYSFCQSTAVSACYEWDVEADLPNQILLSFSKFRCKISQAVGITRATVKAVGERSAYLVRIAPSLNQRSSPSQPNPH